MNGSLLSPVLQATAKATGEDLEQLPEKNPISTVDEAPTHPVSSEPSPSWSASPAQRLRELNALFKEGLIDENDYAKKKRKILDAM